MSNTKWLNTGTRASWVERSDWEFSMSDSDSYSDDDNSVVDEKFIPFGGKTSREMTLGGLVFNSTQFNANLALEQSLSKLLSAQEASKMSSYVAPIEKTKRSKPSKPSRPSSETLKGILLTTASPAEIKRVTSTPALETLNSKHVKSPQAYQYDNEMNLEDIMAMRNLTKEHGAKGFTKSKSLSAPDLTSSSFLSGFKQMDDLGEDDECSESEGEEELTTPKQHRPVASDYAKTNPDEFLNSIVKETFGICPGKVASCELQEFFLPVTPDMISSYDMDVATAVRNDDLRVLSRMQRKGKTLQCCNRFGESIVHTVCRRGSIKLLQFLMERANVSLKVKCDYGRTPLHDACWTRSPNFEMIAIVVEACPDFLWMTDKRGFTPLSYVPKDQWGMWCVFLDEHKYLLKPKILW